MENSKKKCQEQISYTAKGNKIHSESVSYEQYSYTRIVLLKVGKLSTKTSESIISRPCRLRIKRIVFSVFVFCFVLFFVLFCFVLLKSSLPPDTIWYN